jgi:hypothetical protein
MDNSEPQDLPVVQAPALPCRHLRSKGMYVYTDGLASESLDEDDSTIYWCFKSMKSFGPDDEMVGGRECRDPSRSCYESL